MENVSLIRITCDPYRKEISYERCNNGSYVNVGEDEFCSELINEKYTKTAFQSRAYEIVELINKYFNPGNIGLKIDFIGNNDDYDVLENVISTYFSSCNITYERNSMYFLEPYEAMSQIERQFDTVVSTLENADYSETKITDEIAKYKDTIDESIAVCITGLYSAGKSAFINSLAGYEILPSSCDPTTAKVFRITCEKEFSVSFDLNGQTVKLIFSGSSFSFGSNVPEAFAAEVNGLITPSLRDKEYLNINMLLGYINKGILSGIGEIVDITLPFNRSTFLDDHYRFVIYDTPGSNSDSNKRHFEILKGSLEKQTNALLILLTTPDTMDSTDNNNLLRIIEETGRALDTSNAVIVVNKADALSNTSLAEKKDKYQNLKVTKWKSTRIFFLSSVIALGSRKDTPDDEASWVDKDAFETFDEKCRKFQRGDRKLYEYNIIDKSRNIDIPPTEDPTDSAVLFHNSGLAGIEREISDYAKRYALCNKCGRATNYLQNAILYCEENIMEIERERDEELTNCQTLFNNKERELSEILDNCQSAAAVKRSNDFDTMLTRRFEEFKQDNGLICQNIFQINRLSIYSDFRKAWDDIRQLQEQQNFSDDEALSRIQSYVNYKYNALLNAFRGIANEFINNFWEQSTEEFKESCKKIIVDSDTLTDEQKEILNSSILTKDSMEKAVVRFDLNSFQAVRKSFFGGNTFNNSGCCSSVIREINSAVTSQIDEVCKNNSRYFENWSKELVANVKSRLCTFNSELHDYEEKIARLNGIIEEKKAHYRLLADAKSYIGSLLDIQGR